MATPISSFPVTHAGPYGDDPRLVGWRENVGAPVALDARTAWPASARPAMLTVLSWNLWVGRGRLVEVVNRIRAGAYAALGVAAGAPLVVLVQEAFRSDASIPPQSNGWAPRDVIARPEHHEDIVDIARRLGLYLRYAPSMRNGADRSDRGNAILASLPLCDARGLELPLVLQRRVAVAATLELGSRRVLLVSAHLDPRGPPDHRWLGAAGRALQTQHLLEACDDHLILLGADLNLGRGRSERTWRLLSQAGFTFGVPATLPTWRHTYHALPRLVLDYLLIRDRHRTVDSATVHRLDEDRRDRGRTVFGSDHHPLLAPVELS